MSTLESDEHQPQYYPSKDICNRLDISGSTLRKWCIALEENEYAFSRTEQNRRLFERHDFEALQALQELIQSRNMASKNAAIIIASKFAGERSNIQTPSVQSQGNEEIIAKLNDHIEKQEQFNQELLDRLDKQNEYINNNVKRRDQELMETLNQIKADKEERRTLLEEGQEEKRGWLSRLFGKKK